MTLPMETGSITLSRAARQAEFPARFQLVAAMNPCPCGYYGDPTKECTCSPIMVSRYQKRISGPLMDRIDIHVEVPRVPFEKLSSKRTGESSAAVRERVAVGDDEADALLNRPTYRKPYVVPADV